ncbi:MAG TPA: hypothetical protein VFH50_05495 [Acidimicrobiales bacterium]|nr:hypothetical protein [Acidimicrobiales bacterium]
MTEEQSGTVDLDKVMGEIQEEVRRRRAAGDFPPSLERELDLVFDRFVPVGPLDGDFGEAIKAADRAAYINVAVPTASQKPGVGEVKRVLRKAMAWYLEYLAQQITAFSTSTVRALRTLAERTTHLEEQLAEWRPAEDDGRDRPAEAPDLSEWEQAVVGHFSAVTGRVLHAECGQGAIVQALRDAGVDAYGVDPRGPLVDAAVAAGLEAWPDDPVSHLGAVADAGLAGLVLSGCVDRLSLGRQRLLVELAAAKLAPGGRLVILGVNPERWPEAVPALEADLAPGRPLHAVTWSHLLDRARFENTTTTDGAVMSLVTAVRPA